MDDTGGFICYYDCMKLSFFSGIQEFSLPTAVFFLALSAAEHAGGPPVHHRASVGPGRAPWRALLAFKSRETAQATTGLFSDQLEPTRPM